MSAITLSGVTKSFGSTPVLKGIDLTINDGEFVSLVGPSGCGKSTLLRIIAGLEAQSDGSVAIGPRVVDGIRAADRNLSMVFQSYALYPHLTVAENIAVPLRMRQLNARQRLPVVGRFWPGAAPVRREIGEAVEKAAAMLDIGHLLHRKPGQLSGGQRQRVAVGRALVRQPEAFLLDEPLSNLDAKLRVHMRTEIAELHRRLGATFIYVTHDQAEAMTMSNRIAVMMEGEILQCGAPAEIYNDPADIHVAEFIGSPKINILPAEVDAGGNVAVLGAPVELQTAARGAGVRLGIRPEGLAPVSEGPIRGMIRHTENLGSEVFAQLEVQGLADRVVVRLAPGDAAGLQRGQPLALAFPPEQAVLFGTDGKRAAAWLAQPMKAAANG
jgi:multiple sugar transport system ATP-binding protein